MKKNHTEVIFILDASGSMAGKETDVIGGYESFIAKQQNDAGTTDVTVAIFHDHYEIVIKKQDIQQPHKLNYYTGGSTALYDTVGDMITRVGLRYKETPEDERPENVIFIIMTDGANNSSHRYTLDDVSKMIAHQTEVYNWQFIYMGSHLDAWSVGAKMVGASNTVCTDKSRSMAANFRAGGQSVSNYKTSKTLTDTTIQQDYDATDDT